MTEIVISPAITMSVPAAASQLKLNVGMAEGLPDALCRLHGPEPGERQGQGLRREVDVSPGSLEALDEGHLREHPQQACPPPLGIDSTFEGDTRGRRHLGLRPRQLRSVSGDRAICASSVLAATGPRGEVQPDPPEPGYWRTPAKGANGREEVLEPCGGECSGPGGRRLPSRRLVAVVLRSPVGRAGGAEDQPGRSAAASTERCRGCQRGSRQVDLGNSKVSSGEVGGSEEHTSELQSRQYLVC